MKPILWKWSEETIGLQAQMCRWLISGSNPLVPTKLFLMEGITKLFDSSDKEDIIIGMSVLKTLNLSKIHNIINKQFSKNTGYFKIMYDQFKEYKVTNYCAFEKRSKKVGNAILIMFEKENFYVFYDSYVLGICDLESKYTVQNQIIKI